MARTRPLMVVRVALGAVPAVGANPTVGRATLSRWPMNRRAVAGPVVAVAGLMIAGQHWPRKQERGDGSEGKDVTDVHILNGHRRWSEIKGHLA